ncbi:MAG: TIM-barrel domain-containing protein [Anaerolineales bacterium]
MDLTGYVRSIRWLGLRASLEALRFAIVRDRLDRGYAASPVGPSQPVGHLRSHQVENGDDQFDFERAHLEITFLVPDVIRVCWQPGIVPPPYGVAPSDPGPVSIDRDEGEDGIWLRSDVFSVHVDQNGALDFFNQDGELLRRDLPPLRLGERWTGHTELDAETALSGLGERAGRLNLRPGSYRFWNSDPAGSYELGLDPLYLSIPAYLALTPNGSYLVSYENPHDGTLALGDEAEITFVAGQLRYLVLNGSPDHAIESWQGLIGEPAMPPRWALGYHQSRWGYQDEHDIRSVIEGFVEHDLPVSAIHLDIDYLRGYRVFTEDHQRFPSLPALADELKDRLDARLIAILNPGVKIDRDYPIYQQGLQGDHFVKLTNGRPLRGPVWPGAVHFPDFTDPSARRWWGGHYRRLLAMGMAGFWHDMNEPTTFAAWGDTTFPLCARHQLEGIGGDHRTAHNVYGAYMNQAGYQALRAERNTDRPWLLSRSGYTGSARHAWNWTGDTASTWRVLRMTVATVLGLGLSGIPYTGPDIGGFSGEPSAELYARWFELAAFLPFFRTHSSKTSPPREPWSFGPQILDICRKYLRLRQSLMPYLYTLAAESHRSGWPMVRPLYWLQPEESDLWSADDAFLLGDNLLVAPILEEGADGRRVPLPAGRWFDFWTDRVYEGPSNLEVSAALDHVPLFVRAGAILPLSDKDGLTFHLFAPDAGGARSALYSDEGDGYGPSRWDKFDVATEGEIFSLEWHSSGDFPFPQPHVTLALHGSHARQADIDGSSRQVIAGRLTTVPFRRATFPTAP